MESTTPNITLENIREFLKNKNLMIDKKEQYLELEKKMLITYTIIEIDSSVITNDNGSLQIFVSEIDDSEYISKLPTKQRKVFKVLKQLTRIPCWYCYLSWINGSREYRNIGKLLMLYMMLDFSQENRLFIIRLGNSSGKPDTYKIFEFVKVNTEDEEIMSSILLPEIQRNLYSLLFT
jgi:hypothetical protein